MRYSRSLQHPFPTPETPSLQRLNFGAVKPSKRYLKHWPKSTTDDSQISSTTTFHWLCLNYRSIKVNNRGKKFISDKWIYKSTCSMGWVEFAKNKMFFSTEVRVPKHFGLHKTGLSFAKFVHKSWCAYDLRRYCICFILDP